MGLSRRDFLKVSAAGAAAVAALDFAPAPAMAIGPDILDPRDAVGTMKYFHTTCPYCSASCGQVVVVGAGSDKVYDVYGDVDSPINNGGLCAKGAGAYQLVTNKRRLGAFAGTHPVNDTFAYDSSATYADGIAYKRTGNGPWGKVALATAMDDIATKLKTARGDLTPGLSAAGNSRHVQFYGCSHMNNEQNYTYRKLIAQFGTSLVEHQARI
jgi:formate dehydrogenase major subunit